MSIQDDLRLQAYWTPAAGPRDALVKAADHIDKLEGAEKPEGWTAEIHSCRNERPEPMEVVIGWWQAGICWVICWRGNDGEWHKGIGIEDFKPADGPSHWYRLPPDMEEE